ncbi:type IV secretory system conjugative DNA transfer family protein [Clostridium lacusfryxellense]|uniref:type IV secretory system conjugative DNA transfer family protein n=1 Tax=Clostridium lacusfryxellense TaxID=205328 RepID=UPI001C0BDE86|nr:TraM recognition domain-containing protein [Clostridium lacusfryxellense]MBU3114741.1 TraM recognition domain-containing protein [Clostridium lacusfryxellense]
MGALLNIIIVVIIVGVIYQMFLSNKDQKDYDPRKSKIPEYNKANYITPPKETDGYTPEAPSGEKVLFAETQPVISKAELAKMELKKSSILLGKDINGFEDFYISSKELNGMCLIVGATGAGKTECIKTLLEYPLKHSSNCPIIVVDGKGDPKFPNELAQACKKYNRNFKLFSCNPDESMHYNPLRHGLYTELKDKLISLFEFSDDYYKNQSERFLQGVFKLLLLPETKELLGYQVIDFQILIRAFSMAVVENLIEQVGEPAYFMKSILEEADPKAITGFSARLKTIAESELGELFVDTQDTNVIDLMDSIENNDVIFFSLDSLKYAEYAQMLGRLVIADLKTVAPRFADKGKEVFTVFDEFNVFASEIIVNLINKTRAYGFRNIMGTQELADMIINGDEKLLRQVWGNTNVKIALRQDVSTSQEACAIGVGTQDLYKPTISKGSSGSSDEVSNSMSVTLEEEFYYKAREFGILGIGEAIIFVKVPEFRHSKIRIRMVN